ncbi:MAG: T9SS type A sorting domain-containing protein, partial [Flavobacterium sp.]|uniref:T9SS type A sorting domain-containing protein n=1 Tax=Flavobacterium sp. TaxID=239 RepID=UPI0025C5A282
SDNNLCTNTAVSNQIVSACQGIDKVSDNQFFFTLYPNPCSHEFTLKMNDVSEKAILEVYDALGQLVLTRSLTESETRVDVAEMPEGVYVIRVKEGSSKLTNAKLIIH